MHCTDGVAGENAAKESVTRPLKAETAESLLKSAPNQPLTCAAIARALGVSHSTARNQLKPLLEGGIIERHGRGPSTTYTHSKRTDQ
jgi:Fic family protein